MASSDALRLVQEAAASIIDERRRLNDAFEQLRQVVSTFDPSLTLSDDAKLVSVGKAPPPEVRVEIVKNGEREKEMRLRVRAFLKTHGPTRKIDLIEEMDAAPAEVATALEQLLGSDSIIYRLQNGDDVVVEEAPPAQSKYGDRGPAKGPDEVKMEQVAAWLLRLNRPTHYDKVKQEFTAWNVRPVLEALVERGVVRKDSSGLYIHKDVQVAPRQSTPTPTSSRGSGTRQDITPGRTASRAPSVTSRKSRTDAAATASATDYGLARSPKPRSEMKQQQREAEDRLDKVVEWAMSKGATFDSLTARRELGVNRVGDSDYRADGLFGNMSMPKADFDILVDRGVFERTGNFIHPQFKKDMPQGARGRTTPEFRLPKAEAHPARNERDGKQITLEAVRDAAVELKHFTLAELMLKMGAENNHVNRTIVRDHMATLTLRKMFNDDAKHDGGVVYRWSYIEPPTESEAERKVRQDLQRREAEKSERHINRAAGLVQDTSGRGLRAARKEVQEIVDAVVRQWGDKAIRRAGNNHFRITPPEGSQITIGGTPNSRGLAVDKKKLRKVGLVLA